MSVTLQQEDFQRLVHILSTMGDFQHVAGRMRFINAAFEGTPRRDDIVPRIDVDGNPRGVAVEVVMTLAQFGQDELGRETLGVLVNQMLTYLGHGEEADFLYGLFERYALQTDPAAPSKPIDRWRGDESPQDVQEKIIGENTLRDLYFLDLAREAARAVLKIVTPLTSGQMGSGTGFLFAPTLLMTNHHVIRTAEQAQHSQYLFGFELASAYRVLDPHLARAKPGGLFYTHPDLDVTVIELEDVPVGIPPLKLQTSPVTKDSRVNIIQHPGGGFKKISLQNNFVAYADPYVVQYTTSTLPGSSGSPVCNDRFEVVAIHHSGGELAEPNSGRRYLRNAGSSMNAVVGDLRKSAPQIAAQLRS